MKLFLNILTFAVISTTIISCDKYENYKTASDTDLTIRIKTNKIIDSVWVAAISGNQGGYYNFSEEIKIDFKDSINDLYNIILFQDGNRVHSPLAKSQFWLKGENIIIDGTLKDFIEIDTIINSPVHYSGKNYTQSFIKYKNTSNEKILLDSLALNEIGANFESTYSLIIADQFIRRNLNNREKLGELSKLIQDQSVNLKNHTYFKTHKTLNKHLNVDSINLKSYQVYNRKEQLQSIETEMPKTLLDLWFVNCPPCLEDHKKFSKNLDLLQVNDIELIGISVDEKHEEWNNYLTENNYNWSNYRQYSKESTLSDYLSVSAYPEYLLIDNDGLIIQKFDSFDEIKEFLR